MRAFVRESYDFQSDSVTYALDLDRMYLVLPSDLVHRADPGEVRDYIADQARRLIRANLEGLPL